MTDMTENMMTQNADESFVIDNDDKADWAIRKIAEIEQDSDRIIKIAEGQIADLQNRIKKEQEDAMSKTSYFRGLLREYFQTVPVKDTKTTSKYRLLSGELVMKKAKQKMKVDNDKLLEYLQENEMADYIKVETTEKPMWGEFKKDLEIVGGQVINKATGEIVDVVGVEEVPEEFDIKF